MTLHASQTALQSQPDVFDQIHAQAGADVFDQIHSDAQSAKRTDNGEGFWSHVGTVLENQLEGGAKMLRGSAGAGYDEYNAARQQGQGVLPALGRAALATAERGVDPLGLAQSITKGTVETGTGGYQKRRAEGYNSVYSALAPTIAPVVGVDLHSMEQSASQGHSNEVLADAAVPAAETVAGAAASEVAPALARRTAPARSAVAKSAVAPLVKQPLGATQANIAHGIDPAAAITNEGLVAGSREGLVSKINDRVTQLHNATDNALQNHPNANVQLDANPVIDQAVQNGVRAARKVGNDAAAGRIQKLGQALKTEHGETQGTPFQINSLKRSIGESASDLGAFSSTDPVEASVATVMGDVYSGLKNMVNQAIPDVAPLNQRSANLLGARTAINRNIALDTNRSSLSGLTVANAIPRALGSTIGSTPARTLAAHMIAPESMEVPAGGIYAPPEPEQPPRIAGLLPRGPLTTPAPADTSGTIEAQAPPVEPTTRAQRLGLMLPERTALTTPQYGYSTPVGEEVGGPQEPSMSYEAPPISQRTKSGQFQKAYASGVGPQQKGTSMGQIARVGTEKWIWNGEKWYRLRD